MSLLLALVLFQIQGHAADGPTESKVHVSLFGQPCDIVGPVDEATLKLIHSVSPEQIGPSLSAQEVQVALERLRTAGAEKKLPAALEEYRSKLQKRVEAQSDFFKGAETGTSAALLSAVKPHLDRRGFVSFEGAVKKAALKQKAGKWSKEELDLLREDYENRIIAHPEEEFHRQIHHLNVKYDCAFEESEGD